MSSIALQFNGHHNNRYTVRREYQLGDGERRYHIVPDVPERVLRSIGDHTINDALERARMDIGTWKELELGLEAIRSMYAKARF